MVALGLPVVPEVKAISATSSAAVNTAGNSDGLSTAYQASSASALVP